MPVKLCFHKQNMFVESHENHEQKISKTNLFFYFLRVPVIVLHTYTDHVQKNCFEPSIQTGYAMSYFPAVPPNMCMSINRCMTLR